MITFTGPRAMSIRFTTPEPLQIRFASSPVGGAGGAASLPTFAQTIAILDGGFNGDHWREGFTFVSRPAFFGWSDDRVIDASDFPTAESESNGRFTVPAGGPGYWWFAVRVSDGYPDGFTLGESGPDQLQTAFEQLSGVVTYLGTDYHIGMGLRELSSALAGREVRLIWS